jgi:sulfotransferase
MSINEVSVVPYINFISGLCRSGSTLLCNILAQNPRFSTTQTSGCLDVLFSIRNNWHQLLEHRASPCDGKLKLVLKAAFAAYHSDANRPVVFDKSRGWLAYLGLAESILDRKVKVLVPVRPVVDILTSFEKLYRETSKIRQPPGEADNYFQFQTVAGRCEYWMRPDQPVGLSLARLNDAIKSGFGDRMHFVPFDKLTTDPEATMKDIYNFLGDEHFSHNFEHVEQVTSENDEVHGFVDLHKIRNRVLPVKSQALEILGSDVVNRYSNKDK